MTVTIENTAVSTALNIDELTTGSLTGTGVFDVLLRTLRLHLDREFTSGRITGTAYATVYSQALIAFLQQATGYCVSKTKLALELQQLSEQVALLQLQQDQLTADTALKAKELDIRTYELTYIKPQELALTTQQVATQQYTVQTRMPAELASIQADTSLKAYELTAVKPVQVLQTEAQTSHITKQELNTVQQTLNLESQQSQIDAETDKLLYETTYILPENKKVVQYTQDRILAETNKIANETVVTIKQGKLADAQTANTTAQTDLYAQKKVTELAQTTTTPAATSVMGVQNALMVKQTENYERDAEQKAAKIMIDTWNVRRNADTAQAPTNLANRLREDDIGIAVGALLSGLSA